METTQKRKLTLHLSMCRRRFLKLTKRQRDSVLRFLEASGDNNLLRGRMFESHFHELLSQQASLKTRKLVHKHETQPDNYIERFTDQVKMYFKGSADLGDPNNSQKSIVPSSMNYASVNAIIPGCSQVFQMTVSTSHPVNACGWNTVCYGFLLFAKTKTVFCCSE